ncbi:MAG: hypothetical protein EBR82_59895 [Caulobacteraceae bacterium]|nr:hypothetical protein [Caulobacteraceae bacterium]
MLVQPFNRLYFLAAVAVQQTRQLFTHRPKVLLLVIVAVLVQVLILLRVVAAVIRRVVRLQQAQRLVVQVARVMT